MLDIMSYEKYKISDIISNKSEKYNPITSTENFPCVELEHLSQEGTGILLGTVNSKNQQSTKNKFKPGDTLFGKLRPYLKKWHRPNFHGVCSSEIWVLTPSSNLLDKNFLYYLVQSPSFQKEIDSTTGSKMPRADWSIVSELMVALPSLPVQKKIAEFFTLLDERIEKQAEKVAALKEYKKGIQQKIFNRELVFTDDNGNAYPEWEKKKLGEVATLYQPQTISGKDLKSEGYPVYGANGKIGFYGKYNHDTEQVAVTCRGNTCGTLNYTEPFSWITGNAMVINPFENQAIKRFLYYRLEFMNFDSIITGSGQPQITRGPLAAVSLNLPSLPEQEKISEFFSALDEQIELNENKITLLKEQKKGYLQGIFN